MSVAISAPRLTILRRALAAGLLAALLAPIFVPAAVGPAAGGRARMAPGAACCAAMACCAAVAPCATGHCDRGAHPGASSVGAPVAAATPSSVGTRLAAACPGPAPATTVADRDPMIRVSGAEVPFASAPSLATVQLSVAAPSRADAPSVPPPKA
jgi:hypothetical protein